MGNRIFFPFGIIITLFIAFSAISVGGISIYSYLAVKDVVIKAESDMKEYLSPLVAACAQIAASGDDKKNKIIMDPLFADYRKKGIVTKAFFVKDDGSVIAHSDASEVATLKNNIATDEFTYNLDQIFLPLKQNSAEIYITDYYLIDRQFPFDKKITKYLKQYFDKNIDRNGWLLSKSVFDKKGKGYGVVAFIVNKEAMYDSIKDTISNGIKLIRFSLAGSACLAFFISLIVFIRYRMIHSESSSRVERKIALINRQDSSLIYDSDDISDRPVRINPVLHTEQILPRKISDSNIVILDAIPVKRKGAR
ncbi:MAG TPA: hypothetical protein VF857_04850 [Spirochaetota bacterium]